MKNEKGYLRLILCFSEKTTEELARKEIKNYLRRVRAYRQTRGMKLTLQYIFGVDVRAAKNHGILVMSRIDVADAGALWKKGMVFIQTINTNEVKPERVAEDMWAHCPGSEWTCSRNLKARYLKHVMKYLNEEVAG